MANLTPDNLEELQKAAILAQILVNNENRLATLQRCGAPEKVIAMQKDRLLDFEEKVRGNSLATELLPQARQVVAMRETRRQVFKDSDFPRESGSQNR
jgi:hypothetical protein